MEYKKVLNTVPTLGGVKSGFHEAKQESIIKYESDFNSLWWNYKEMNVLYIIPLPSENISKNAGFYGKNKTN